MHGGHAEWGVHFETALDQSGFRMNPVVHFETALVHAGSKMLLDWHFETGVDPERFVRQIQTRQVVIRVHLHGESHGRGRAVSSPHALVCGSRILVPCYPSNTFQPSQQGPQQQEVVVGDFSVDVPLITSVAELDLIPAPIISSPGARTSRHFPSLLKAAT